MIPPLRSEDVVEASVFKITLNDPNTAFVKLNRHSSGPSFEEYREAAQLETIAEKIDYMQSRTQLKNFEIDSLFFSDSKRSAPTIHIEIFGTLKNPWRQIGRNYLIELPQTLKLPKVGTPQTRKYPLRIDYPINQSDTIQIQLPFQFEVTIPTQIELQNDFGSFTMSIQSKENSLNISKTLKIRNGDWSLDKYEDFYNFLDSVTKSEKVSLLIKPK